MAGEESEQSNRQQYPPLLAVSTSPRSLYVYFVVLSSPVTFLALCHTERQAYEYNARGQLIGLKDGNGNQTEYKRDGWGRIGTIKILSQKYAYLPPTHSSSLPLGLHNYTHSSLFGSFMLAFFCASVYAIFVASFLINNIIFLICPLYKTYTKYVHYICAICILRIYSLLSLPPHFLGYHTDTAFLVPVPVL